MSSYLQTVEEVYAEAAGKPDVELCCTRSPLWHLPGLHVPPLIFTGRTATCAGPEAVFEDGRGHTLRRGIPALVSNAAADRLGRQPGIVLTGPTYHCKGGGCC